MGEFGIMQTAIEMAVWQRTEGRRQRTEGRRRGEARLRVSYAGAGSGEPQVTGQVVQARKSNIKT